MKLAGLLRYDWKPPLDCDLQKLRPTVIMLLISNKSDNYFGFLHTDLYNVHTSDYGLIENELL